MVWRLFPIGTSIDAPKSRSDGPVFLLGIRDMNSLRQWLTIRLDNELFQAVREKAQRERLSMSDVMRLAAVAHLRKQHTHHVLDDDEQD
jgi:hypothetical protein